MDVVWLKVGAGVVGAAAAVHTTVTLWKSAGERWSLWRRKRRAARGEVEAERLLRKHGYRILDRQVEHTWTIYGNDRPTHVGLRADLLVSKGGRDYVAEVKTGRVAPLLRTSQTRRQLLEYSVAYDVDGVLLVDMEAYEIQKIHFPPGGQGQGGASKAGLSWSWASFVMGAAVGALLVAWQAGWLGPV